jgi:hypothetical protein
VTCGDPWAPVEQQFAQIERPEGEATAATLAKDGPMRPRARITLVVLLALALTVLSVVPALASSDWIPYCYRTSPNEVTSRPMVDPLRRKGSAYSVVVTPFDEAL